jgi:hypothetical protein
MAEQTALAATRRPVPTNISSIVGRGARFAMLFMAVRPIRRIVTSADLTIVGEVLSDEPCHGSSDYSLQAARPSLPCGETTTSISLQAFESQASMCALRAGTRCKPARRDRQTHW